MDYEYTTTNTPERKRGQHLQAEDRGAIQQLEKLGYSNRAIAKELNCSPSTVGYELRRGTPPYKGRGRRPAYSAKRGAAVYKERRKKCHRPRCVDRRSRFVQWMVEQIRNHKWSFDTCVGYARKHHLFPANQIPCTKTLYNMLWANELPLTLFDVPEALSRRKRRMPRIHKRMNRKSIDFRPQEVNTRSEFGHWESDTVIGRKRKSDPVVFTIVERMTGYYLSIKISGKTVCGVSEAMKVLKDEFGDKFSQVFRSITTDNGAEFADFSSIESDGTEIYFAHPYSAWERPVNERSNRILRRFVLKGKSIDSYTAEELLMFSDEINFLPRKILGYSIPEELFEAELDKVYAADCSTPNTGLYLVKPFNLLLQFTNDFCSAPWQITGRPASCGPAAPLPQKGPHRM